MGTLQSDKVVFYHPLNDSEEHTQSQAWDGTAAYDTGKVAGSLKGVSTPGGYGATSQIDTTSYFIAAAALDSTRLVVVYRGSTPTEILARVGTLSGGSVTFGAATDTSGYAGGIPDTHDLAVDALDSSKVLFAGGVVSAGKRKGYVRVGTVSGTDITVGDPNVFLNDPSGNGPAYLSVAALDAATGVLCYQDQTDSHRGKASVCTVSGTSVTVGPAHSISSETYMYLVRSDALDASSFVVCYRAGGAPRAKVGTVSGTDITFGAQAGVSAGDTDNMAVAALGADRFVVCWSDESDGNKGKARVGHVSGGSISLGAAATFADTTIGGDGLAAAATGADSFVACYRDQTDSNHGKSAAGTVSGTDITFGSSETFLSDFVIDPAAVGLGAGFAVCYRKGGASNPGEAAAWQEGSASSSLAAPAGGATYPPAAAATKVAFCGWLKKPSA